MSAKWRALQHRHRYTYSAVIFPQSYVDSLDRQPIDEPTGKFYRSLKELLSLSSTYAQIGHVKKVASEFSSLLVNGQEVLVSVAARFYLEILFFENSNPLHRTLVSVLAKNPKFSKTVGDCFRLLFEEYGGVNGKGKRFCLSRVALSMMSTPKLGYLVDVVEKCATLVAMDIVCGLKCVVSEANDGSRPSPLVLEQCQETLSCIYYLLQRFPSRFSCISQGDSGLIPEDSCILDMIMTTILSILKSTAFSRDCFVAAGVSFCAALQLFLSPEDLSLAITENIFNQKKMFMVGYSEKKLKGNLFSEIKDLSPSVRLWLLRGILTAISRTVLNAHFVVLKDDNAFSTEVDKGSSVWTILYDGILPELCYYCENRTDSHSNFHALTVMQICLQQIKTSILTDIGKPTENYGLISEEMGTRILSIIWNNLEDPLNQTVKQVHMIFDLFMEIQSTLHCSEGSDKVKLGLRSIASKLLHMGPHRKGRYIPLSLLTKRLGAKGLLDMCPRLLFESIDAFIEDDACCAATTFLKGFLECLRDECWSEHGIENGYAEYRNHCLPPLLFGLASDCSKLRSNLNTYALPVMLELDVDAIFPMLSFISIRLDGEESELMYPEINHVNMPLREEQQVAVSVSLLKVSRLLALIEGDIDWHSNCSTSEFASFYIKGVKIKILVKWLIMALTHVDESIRIDAAESLLLNPKTASLPSGLELALMKEAVPLNMRCVSTAFQMKWTSLFRKFCARVNTALERQIKQGKWKPLSCFNNGDETVNRAEDLFSFMKWLSSFLFFSCYPSAPYERKIMAMELILVMFNHWPILPSLRGECDSLYPYSRCLTSPDSTLLLVGSIVDSWDHLRENSLRILLHFPTPLPGISSLDVVKEVITWAKDLICSPRVRECDAGALTLRLIFRKYVIELGWIVRPACNEIDENNHGKSPVIEYIRSLIDWLYMTVEKAENDLSESCRNSFVHGILLTLRYTFEELEWGSSTILCHISDMKNVLEKLLELITRITSIALWVVSADAWYLPVDMDDLGEDDVFFPDTPDELGISLSSSECMTENSKSEQDSRPMEQIVMVGCWLAMKEISLLLGTIIRKIPLPTSDGSNSQGPSADDGDSLKFSDSVLNLTQLETIGNHFLEVLLKMKHNGAIDKTRAGFTALCNRLLCSNDPRLCKLTESWMDQLMERTIAKGQTVDDLLRRSAGIPAAFIALFLSEPEGTPKRLLPKALRWLLDVAARSYTGLSNITNERNVSTQSSDIIVNGISSKIRDEGVVPTVHAFNILRAAFNDANLGTDTSGFSAEAMIIAIRSFSSAHWEIRNSACLAYTALVRRMIGFLNVQKRVSARRALTGLEFFHRYPLLHPFFLEELKVATELLSEEASRHPGSNLANYVHPSLCPMLILLSRLKPSSLTTETEDSLDPFIFMPFIRKCSIQNNHRVRVLSSRALVGLVSNEKLHSVLLNIARQLPPSGENQTLPSFNSIHGTLLQLISLLDINCHNIADFAKKDQIIVDLFSVVGSNSWLGSRNSCPCPTLNSSFLNVLDHMLNIARTCSKEETIVPICNLLRDLSSECFDPHEQPSYDPTVVELHKQATNSYLNCFSQESSLKMLSYLMTNALYEVRTATLKWLLLFIKDHVHTAGKDFSNWIGANLQETLFNLLATEKNRKCICYILKIIFTWDRKHEFRQDELLITFWNNLVSLYKSTRYAKTREMLICCMGICVKRFSLLSTRSDQSENAKQFCEYVEFYVGLIKQHSSSSEPANMRKAVAESLVASDLLDSTTIDEHALELLDLWYIAIKLLEDEDVELRRKLANDVQKCFTSKHSIIPSQVEKVIELSFEHLSLNFGNCLPYYNFLCESVLKDASYVVQNRDLDLVRRVFDKEIDNHHEEKLLICQLCCYHLEKLPISKILSDSSFPDEKSGRFFLHEWRSKFLDRVVEFSQDRINKQEKSSVNWIGGVGNHKDVFLPLYGNLLGFYAVSGAVLNCYGESVVDDDVVLLGKIIDPFLKNPLILGLFSKVVERHGRSVIGRTSWDGFDPYFLVDKR